MVLDNNPIDTYSLPTNNEKNNYTDEVYYASADEIAYAIQKYDADLYQAFVNNAMVLETTDSFVSDSVNVLTGELWDTIRTDLNDYTQYITMSEELNKVINETQQRCLRIIQGFLAPDEDLNTADLPKFETEKNNIEKEIENLKNENEQLSQVPETIRTGGSGTEEDPYIYSHNPEYDAAQYKISSNNIKIESTLIPALNEVNRLINKINEFNTVILPSIERELNDVSEKVNRLALQIDYMQTSDYSNLEKTLSTGFVGLTSVVSGVVKEGENLIDGVTWGIGKLCLGMLDVVSDTASTFGADRFAEIVDNSNESMKESMAEWIATDHVENWNRDFYEGLGSGINKASYMAYDSETAQKIQSVAEKATEVGLEIGATVLTGNTGVATAIGSLTEMGKASEELYSTSDNPTLNNGTRNILLHGAIGAANGHATGGFGMSLSGAAHEAVNLGTEVGVKEIITSGIGNAFGKDSFIGNAFQVAGNMADRTLDGKENNALTFTLDVVSEFGLNSWTNSVSSGSTVSAQTIGRVGQMLDNISDSGILDSSSEISGVDLSWVRFIG